MFAYIVLQHKINNYYNNLLHKVFVNILDPIILVMFAAAVAVFFYGLVVFINNTENPTVRETGKRNMIWGIVGIFIMVSAYGILNFIGSTIGKEAEVSRHLSR